MDWSSRGDALEPLVESFLTRYRNGERPSIEDYIKHYPDLAEEIREAFPTLVMIEQHISLGETKGGPLVFIGSGSSGIWPGKMGVMFSDALTAVRRWLR
jgi:hypothetical protein